MNPLDYISLTYQVVIASEHLLGEAIFLLEGRPGWEADMRAFFQKHLDDERHHAEWFLEDMAGHPITLHLGAAEIAGTGYYLVRHVHPVALLGYMLALESHPVSMEYVEAVERAHGKAAARTLRIHAEQDPGHADELLTALAHVPPEWRPLVEKTRTHIRKLIEGL